MPLTLIDSVSVSVIIKNVPILQECLPAPLTLPVFRVVLFYTKAGGKRLFGDSVGTCM